MFPLRTATKADASKILSFVNQFSEYLEMLFKYLFPRIRSLEASHISRPFGSISQDCAAAAVA